jgi:hypothetical protein
MTTTGSPPSTTDAEDVLDIVEEQDIIHALQAGHWNIPAFARDILGVDSHAGQDALFDLAIARTGDGWSPAYLTITCSAGNRAGKTLGLAIIVAHSTLYKMGLPLPYADDDSSLKAWNQAPFDWYHFGISQEVAELLHLELVRLLRGIHEAQKGRGCPLTMALGEDVADWDMKERGEWRWFKWAPVLGGGEIHFRTTGEKALSTLGRDMNGWSYDEPAFDPNLTFVFDEVLNLRRMSTGGQAILIATATEGSQAYHDLWARGDPLAPDRQPDYASVRISTRQNVGYGINSDMFDRMLRTVPPGLVPQNIDGWFIEARDAYFAAESVNHAFYEELQPHVEYQPGHLYVHGVDPAITYDSTWSIVLDITDEKHWVGVSAKRKSGRQTAESIIGLTSDTHQHYAQGGRCLSGIDATGFGGKVFASLLQSARTPVLKVEFGGKSSVKQKLLANVRTALDSGRLMLPKEGEWLSLRRQLLGYKLADRRLETDAVMALAIAVKMATRQLIGEGKALPFDYFGPTRTPHPLPNGVTSLPEAPRRYVDDRASRLDTLTTATVVPMRGMFTRHD